MGIGVRETSRGARG